MRATIIIVFGFCLNATIGFSQESETDELKQQIELLTIKLELAEKSAELLETELESLRKENARLKGEEKKSVASQDDPFEPGSVWAGNAINNDKIKTHWALSVAERNGRKFAGAIAAINEDGKKHEIAVSGTAPENGNGVVVIESPIIGRAKLFMRGKLNNGAIALVFSGTTPLGKKFFGSAELKAK